MFTYLIKLKKLELYFEFQLDLTDNTVIIKIINKINDA